MGCSRVFHSLRCERSALAMDIGVEGEPYVIEPLEEPVPGRKRETIPEVEPFPDLTPEIPTKTPELVPA